MKGSSKVEFIQQERYLKSLEWRNILPIDMGASKQLSQIILIGHFNMEEHGCILVTNKTNQSNPNQLKRKELLKGKRYQYCGD